MVQAYAKLPDWRGTAQTVRHENRHILAAIRDGDPSRASQLVQDHIESFYDMVGRLGWDVGDDRR